MPVKLPGAKTISPTRTPFSHTSYSPLAVMYSRASPLAAGKVLRRYDAGRWGLYGSAAPLPAASFSACLRSQLGRAKALMASSPGMSISSVSGSTHSPCQSLCAKPVSKCASLHAPGVSFSSHRRTRQHPRTREPPTVGASACTAALCTLPLCQTVSPFAVSSIS